MGKTKVTVKFAIAEYLDRFVTGTFAAHLGNEIVDAVKEEIAEGKSPVRGQSRFARYKDRKKYPGELKPARPVNLFLTGKMLEGFSSRLKSKNSIEVGMIKGSEQRKEVAGYHNEGTENMAKRQFIPQAGEEFSVRIMRRIREVYGLRLADLIKQSNKKGSS